VWTVLAAVPPDSGSYDWTIPDAVSGSAEFQITVRDRLGHETVARSDVVVVGQPLEAKTGTGAGDRAQAGEGRLDGSTQPSQDESKSLRLYKSGVFHALRGEYALAMSDLTASLAIRPHFTPALVEVGNVLYAQHKFAEAIEAYRIAVGRSPDSADALYGLAQAMIGRRQFTEARNVLNRLVAARPKLGKAWLLLGDVSLFEGREESAVGYFQNAIRFARSSEVARTAGDRLENLKRMAGSFGRQVPSP